jgi:hypothetical protein
VHHALGVGGRQRGRYLGADLERQRWRHRQGGPGQGRAVQQLHHDERSQPPGLHFGLSVVEHSRHVGVGELGRRQRLGLDRHPPQQRGLAVQHLDRDVAVQHRIPGAPDLRHAALTEALDQSIAASQLRAGIHTATIPDPWAINEWDPSPEVRGRSTIAMVARLGDCITGCPIGWHGR